MPHMKDQNGRRPAAQLPYISPRLFSKLRKREIAAFQDLSEEEQTRVWTWSREIIREYRSTLESNRKNIRDVKELPASKDDIKLAIKIALPVYVSKELQRMIKVLKNAYKELGAFQPLETAQDADLSQTPSGLESRNDGQVRGDKAGADTASVVSEKKALTEEINNFVTDLESLA